MESVKGRAYASFLDKRISAHENARRDLLADRREDEAVWMRIRANVAEIFRKMFLACGPCADSPETRHFRIRETVGGASDPAEAAAAAYRRIAETITGPWRASLAQAAEKGDAQTERIERIKLGEAEEIMKVFEKIRRGEDHSHDC